MPAVYDRLACFYDRAFAPFEKRWLGRLRAEVLGMMPADSTLLELGAGTGANFQFYPAAKLAVASELSCKMIEYASERRTPIHIVQADAQQLPFDENRFDAAFATLVFCSIPKPELAFAEVKRVVRPGGRVVLLEHVRPDGWLGYVFDALSILTVALIDDHFNRQTAKIAASQGLEIADVRKMLGGSVNLIDARVPA